MALDSLTDLIRRYGNLRDFWREPEPGAALDWQTAGIFDPDAGMCVSQHYALSHLMLAAGLLSELTRRGSYADDCAAMAALLARHQAARYAPYEPGSIHWDFNNFAWLDCAMLPGAERVRDALRDPALGALGRENGTWAGNWLTMRQVNRTLRGRLGLPNRNWRSLPEYVLWQRIFRRDGGIDEFPGRSRPVQYHAYVLALMLRRFLASGSISARDERRLHAGTSYLMGHIDSLGNANYRGRGQYQLFFEGCARYVLAVMAAWHGDDAGKGHCADALAKLAAVPWPVRPDGLLALVRTDPASERRGSHYDYHHATVYNAFDLAWRLRALLDSPLAAGLPLPRLPAPAPAEGLFACSRFWTHRYGGWLVALSGGEDMYLSDVGVTFCHLAGPRGVIFTAPGGPHPSHYGTQHGHDGLRANVFSPVYVGVDGCGLPHFRRGTIEKVGDTVRVSVHDGRASIDRSVTTEGPLLRVHDSVAFPPDAPLAHLFHWALPVELSLRLLATGEYAIGRDGDSPLAILRFCTAEPPSLECAAPFRGPGGVVTPWFIRSAAPTADITFTLELCE